MSTQKINNPASDKQLAYIKSLQMEIGMNDLEINNEIDNFEASRIIGELIEKAQKPNSIKSCVKVNQPRLGMAMKECFRLWTGLGRDIWGEHRKAFVEKSIDTYAIFTEIAQRLEKNEADTQ